jgi:hypothetical protein
MPNDASINNPNFALSPTRQFRIVSHYNDRSPTSMQLIQQFHHFGGHVPIQIPGRLIRQQQPRRTGERPRDGHALSLTP